MVGQMSLEHPIGVQIPVPQPITAPRRQNVSGRFCLAGRLARAAQKNDGRGDLARLCRRSASGQLPEDIRLQSLFSQQEALLVQLDVAIVDFVLMLNGQDVVIADFFER